MARYLAGALVVCCCLGTLGAQELRAGAQQGMRAPDIPVKPVNGKSVTLARLIDPNGALVAFADPRNRDGQRLIVYLQQSHQRLQELKVGVLLIALGVGQPGKAQDLVRQNQLTLPVVPDPGNRLANSYGVSVSAAAVIVGPDGTVYRRYDATTDAVDLGPMAMGGVRDLLESLQAAGGEGQDVPADQPSENGTTAAEGSAPKPAALVPEEFRKRVRAGWRLIQAGAVEDALAEARVLAEQQGRDRLSLLWLAYCLEAARQYPEAAVTYREVLKAEPGNRYALQAVARIDPAGRYRTAADLPQPASTDGSDGQGGAPAATTSEGPGSVGR